MSKLTKQLKANRASLIKAAESLAGQEGREADVSFAMTRAAEIDSQLRVAESFQVHEPDTYGAGSPYSIVADVIATQTQVLSQLLPNRFEAQARLARYAQYDATKLEAKRNKATEKAHSDLGVRALSNGAPVSYRDLTTLSNASAFVPPKIMLDQWVEAARANSVAQSVCRTLPLPPACDQILIPGITESYNAQAITAEDIPPFQGGPQVTTYPVMVGVRQYAQIVPLSLQLLERGGSFFESVLIADANAGLAEQIDVDLIAGNGLPESIIPGVAGTVAGQILGVASNPYIPQVTYTDGSPSVPALYEAIISGIKAVDQNRRRPPQHLLMLPELYHAIAGHVPPGSIPFQPTGKGDDDNEGVVHSADVLGYIAGVPVLGAYGTGYGYGATGDENIVVIGRFEADALLLVSQPAFNFVDEGFGAQSLQVNFVARQYVAYCTRLPSGFAVLGGTGLKRGTV